MFKIVYHRFDQERLSNWGNGYTTEDEAWEKVHDLLANDTSLCGVFAFEVVVDWAGREQGRFDAGTYKPPVWRNEVFWKRATRDGFGQHYAHISTEDPTMLAYTPDDEKGAADRQTRLKPGKYLTKFFGASEKPGPYQGLIADGPLKGSRPALTKQQIAYYAEWWEKGAKPSKFENLELHWAETPEEIAHAYMDGPRSCMGGSEGGRMFTKAKTHPATVYGAGDLFLAYLQEPSGKIMARAICWPEKKTFGRVYPSPSNWPSDGFASETEAQDCQNELHERLKKLGYASIGERKDALDGARLLRIPIADRAGYFRMPYLDNEYHIVEAEGDDKSKFFIMKRDDGIRAGMTDGTVFFPETFVCGCCARTKQAANHEGRHLKFQVFTVYDPNNGPAEPKDYCYDCQVRWAYKCRGTDTWFDSRNVSYVTDDYEGWKFARAWAGDRAYSCAYDGYNYVELDNYPAKTKVVIGGKTYAKKNVHNVAFHCLYDGQDYLFKEMSLKYPGFPKAMDKDEISVADRERCSPMRRLLVLDEKNLQWVNSVTWPYVQDEAAYFWASRKLHNERDAERRRLLKAMAMPSTSYSDEVVQIMAAE